MRTCFHSLQTGKRISSVKRTERCTGGRRFNSLQTGKRISSLFCVYHKGIFIVSIPFKRESVSQAKETTTAPERLSICFNSLQTGKRISSKRNDNRPRKTFHMFQFPSNGKAYLKLADPNYRFDEEESFQFPSNGKAYLK